MPAIVDFPTAVKEALEEFGPAFANEPERKHFAEYLTGLMIANKKNVSAIHREFAVTTDQSCPQPLGYRGRIGRGSVQQPMARLAAKKPGYTM